MKAFPCHGVCSCEYGDDTLGSTEGGNVLTNRLLLPAQENAFPWIIVYFYLFIVLGGVMVVLLATGLNVRGYKPGRERWIFKEMKISSATSFGRDVKPSVGPMP
jgi:hypothetical protein